MFLQMASFAALARELQWSFSEILLSTYLIWGLPGQLAMVDMTASGASWLAVFMAVAMANARMAAMTVSAIPLLPYKSYCIRLLAAQVMGITLWMYTREQLAQMAMTIRGPRYIGFASLMLLVAGFGCVLGYFSHESLPPILYQLLVFLGPVFLLMLISAARMKEHRLTALLAGIFCFLSTPLTGTWAVIISGLLIGSLGYLMAGRQKE